MNKNGSKAKGNISEKELERLINATERAETQAHQLFSQSIKGLTLVNGAAAVALIAFLGNWGVAQSLTTVTLNDTAYVLACFAVGTICPIIASLCLTYYQMHSVIVYRKRVSAVLAGTEVDVSTLKWLRDFGRVLIVLAIFCFLAGIYFSWDLMVNLGFGSTMVRPT